MKQKHVDACREVRLWIVQVIVPTIVIMTAFPETRQWVSSKVEQGKAKLKEKLER